MQNLASTLQAKFPEFKFKLEEPLARYTTVKIGGPAEVFFEAKNEADLAAVLQFARQEKIMVTMLGWGANVLIADRGIRGLVIRNKAGQIKILGEGTKTELEVGDDDARWEADRTVGTFKYDFADLDYSENDRERVLVEIGAGVGISQAIDALGREGITGLQWFARIPSTIGGAIYNNIHGGSHLLGEVVESVKVLDEAGKIVILNKDELDFAYDSSRFHRTKEIILSAVFNLFRGDVEKARTVVKVWGERKSLQPQNSLGCTFKNISAMEKTKLGYPTTSAGYLIEHILGLKGFGVGAAVISDYHCAFIENRGGATAADYLAVIKKVIDQAKVKTGLTLTPEIFFLGFEKSELAGIVA